MKHNKIARCYGIIPIKDPNLSINETYNLYGVSAAKGTLVYIGGGVHTCETPLECLYREICEESCNTLNFLKGPTHSDLFDTSLYYIFETVELNLYDFFRKFLAARTVATNIENIELSMLIPISTKQTPTDIRSNTNNIYSGYRYIESTLVIPAEIKLLLNSIYGHSFEYYPILTPAF